MAELNALGAESDGVLAARVPTDFDAFAELYRRYLGPIYRFVRSQVSDDVTAEDLTAQVFFKALSSASTYRGEGAYRSWLYRIAHNVVVSFRTQKAKSDLVVEEVPETLDTSVSPVTAAINGEERIVVRAKVAELPPAQREVVALRYLEDFSTEEVAQVTGRSRGAVRILLHRARQRLRKAFAEREVPT